jgi:hypothetical protein
VKELLDAAQDAMLKAHAAHVKRIHARGGHKSGTKRAARAVGRARPGQG